MDIILYLLQLIQYQQKQICWLLNFICKYIPLKQWAFDDSHSPKYQKFIIDELPKVISFKQEWNWKDLISYYQWRYHKTIRPVFRRVECDIPKDCTCPACVAPVDYLMWNDGKKKSQILCKVCQTHFSPSKDNRFSKTSRFHCPHCSHSLVHKKDRKHFIVHKCVNPKCPYYLHNLKKVDKADLDEYYGKKKYKLHYIYREFTIDFFRMDLNSLPKHASSLRFSKFDQNVLGLCLYYKVNLGLSLRKTAALCIKPFVDNYDYSVGKVFTADETYIKIRGVKGYIWFIMDAVKRSIIGYQISDNRGVGPCILSMRMAFKHLKKIPENFKFIADGYSAYLLAAQQFFIESKGKMKFDITQVIGLTNDDEVSKESRPYPYKQMIEHVLCEYKVLKVLGQNVQDPTENLDFLDQEMESCTDEYRNYCMEQYEKAKQYCSDPLVLVEQRLDFSKWVPDGFGTVDCLIVADKALRIVDFKFGLGILVEAENNPQMMCYALGALDLYGKYTDEATVASVVTSNGYDPYEKKLLGITEMTFLLGKKKFQELLGGLVIKPPGKPSLVPESDKRPALNTAKDDFDDI